MTSKGFSILILFTLVFGGALGAAFTAGVVLGKSQGADLSQESSAVQAPRRGQGSDFRLGGSQGAGSRQGSNSQALGGRGQQPVGEFRSRRGGIANRSTVSSTPAKDGPSTVASGDAIFEEVEVRGVNGTVDQVEDNLVTLATFQGLVRVALHDETNIHNTIKGTVADLVEGANIRVIGRSDRDGNLQARAVTLLSEDIREMASGRESRGGFGRPGPVTGTIVSAEDGLVTVGTVEGPVKVFLRAETIIQKTAEGTERDLVKGIQVRVIGMPGDAGTIIAQSLTVIHVDAGRHFGRREGRRSR